MTLVEVLMALMLLVNLVLAGWIKHAVERVHVSVNGRLTELVEAVRAAARAEGFSAGQRDPQPPNPAGAPPRWPPRAPRAGG